MSLEGNIGPEQVLRGRVNLCDVLLLSAYAIAVKHGFEGTEEEWLESLRGADGISSIYILDEGESLENIPETSAIAIDPFGGGEDAGDYVEIVLDTSLTREGYAADAKAVGDKFEGIDEVLDAINGTGTIPGIDLSGYAKIDDVKPFVVTFTVTGDGASTHITATADCTTADVWEAHRSGRPVYGVTSLLSSEEHMVLSLVNASETSAVFSSFASGVSVVGYMTGNTIVAELVELANADDIPTLVSRLENDAGYLTADDMATVIDLTKYKTQDGTTINDIILGLFASGGGYTRHTEWGEFWNDVNAKPVCFLFDVSAMTGYELKIESEAKSCMKQDGSVGVIETSFLATLTDVARVTVYFDYGASVIAVIAEPLTIPGA